MIVCTSFLAIGATAQDQAAPGSAATAESKAAAKPGSDLVGGSNAAQAPPKNAAGDSSLRLGAGDLIEVSVYNVPELTSKARVSNTGDVYLPLIDYVHVAGLTADEAQEIVQKKLADGGFVKNPHVTIFIDQYATQGVSVLGEVAKSGIYPALGEQRLFDLLSAAGGLTERSGRNATVTHRKQPDQPEIVPLSKNLSDNPQSNVRVFPGDTVIVRAADIVYVVGDVAKPAGLLIDRGTLTVMQAVALAGGTTRTSRPNGAKIIHKGPAGMTETPVHLKKILQAKAPDVTLNPDDILFVPSSALKGAVQDNLSLATQAASLSLYVVR